MSAIKTFAFAAAAALALAAPAAKAQDASRWIVHAGPAVVTPDESASMKLGGAPVPGADVKISQEWTAEVEGSYFLTKNIAVGLAAGFPPKFKVDAAGSLAGAGEVGKMTGGPAGLLVQYHFNRDGMVSPYVGAGAAFLVVFGTDDGLVQGLKAKSAVGTALQAGANIWLNDRWGAFIDVKKAFVETTAKGSLFGAPVVAEVKIDPLVTNFGVSYRF